MLRAAIAGASGYAGAELCALAARHPELKLTGLYVSPGSSDLGRPVSQVHGFLRGRCDLPLQAFNADTVPDADLVFLATDHQVSHDAAARLIRSGITVFDLSGAFRLSDREIFAKFYGFPHQYPDLLTEAVYALPEHTAHEKIRQARLLALPGCYPTSAQLALRPLLTRGLADLKFRPVINSVSGVSGAGRKAKLSSSFCEVSLNAYGLFTHRHRPEIEEHLGCKVIFNAHLGSFKRGILSTVTVKLTRQTDSGELKQAFMDDYGNCPLVRLTDGLPRVQDVQGLPVCDIGCAGDGSYAVVCAALDNLLKGAASQAVQVMNIHYGFSETLGLWP